MIGLDVCREALRCAGRSVGQVDDLSDDDIAVVLDREDMTTFKARVAVEAFVSYMADNYVGDMVVEQGCGYLGTMLHEARATPFDAQEPGA